MTPLMRAVSWENNARGLDDHALRSWHVNIIVFFSRVVAIIVDTIRLSSCGNIFKKVGSSVFF